MGIKVLGPLAVDGSGRLGPRDRVVLQALAVRQGRPVAADELVDVVWGDHPPPSAHKNIQSCIVRLRKALGPGTIETTDQGYRLALPPDEVDARRFEAQVVRARELLALGEVDRVVFQLENALGLWEGRAFADLADWGPARREAGRLDELRLDAEELLLDAQLRRGHTGEVLSRAHEMVRAAPLRERRWELLALAQYRSGAQGESLRTIRQLRAVLARELGIDPSSEVAALEEAILRQDPTLLVPAARHATTRCPWQGLRAYDIDDAERFFGRDADVTACLAVLARRGFVTVAGPSGSGKSSLLRAGVLAALHERGHDVVLITPGPRPLEALSALGPDAPARTVLAVDQGEELWTLCEDLDDRQAFLERLTVEARRRPVLVAIRGDRLTQATDHPAFSRLVEEGLHLVGALGEEGLREAIERPAQQAGLVLEPGLVELLVREVRDDPGALPLLSHALLETWHRREGSTLTVDGYHASGGIHGAVAQSAEALYAQMDGDQRRRLRDLVLRLVSPGADGEAVRTRVARRLVAADHDHDRLIESLVAARLVTSDEDVLEITHEALARAWPRLRGWLEDDVEGQRIRHHLSGAADAWDGLGRPDSELYRGVRLARALDWAGTTDTALTDAEREFLDRARAVAEIEEQTAAERARAQARLIHRLRIVLGGAAVLLVLALAAGGVAAVQSERANDQAAAAALAELRAVARRAGASALVTDDIDTSLLLGAAAAKMDDSPQTLGSLVGVLARRPALVASIPLAGDDPRTLDVHPGGRLIAVLDTHHRVRLLDRATGTQLAERQVGPTDSEAEEVRPMGFSPDGRYLAVARTPLSGAPLELLDARTLEPVAAQPRGTVDDRWHTIDLSFSQDGTRLAATVKRVSPSEDGWSTEAVLALVWEIDDPSRPVARVDLTNPREWASAALSPSGGQLYSMTPDLRVHDLTTGGSRLLASETDLEFGDVEISPDGRLLAQGRSGEGETVLRDADDGHVVHRLPLAGEQGGIRFSHDGTRVLTVVWHDRDAAVWETSTGDQVFRVQLADGSSGAVDLDPRGRGVVSAAQDGAIRSWDTVGERRYLRRVAVPDIPWREDGGACLAVPSRDGTKVSYDECGPGFVLERKLLLDVPTGELTASRDERGLGVGAQGSWHPDGTAYAQVLGDSVATWGVDSQVVVSQSDVPTTTVDVQYTPSGRRVVLSHDDGTVRLADSETLTPVGRAVRLGGTAWAVPGPDDRRAFAIEGRAPAGSGYYFKNDAVSWALLDLEEGETISTGPLDIGFVNSIAYSRDGRYAAAAGDTGRVAVIDLVAGRAIGAPQPLHVGGGAGWVAFSPDGRRMVSTGFEGDVALWDVESATVTARVAIQHSVLSAAAFIEGTDEILIAPWWADPAVYVWDPSREHAVEAACRAAGRDLTREEWTEHFGDLPFRTTCPQ